MNGLGSKRLYCNPDVRLLLSPKWRQVALCAAITYSSLEEVEGLTDQSRTPSETVQNVLGNFGEGGQQSYSASVDRNEKIEFPRASRGKHKSLSS